jgi:hypothetical protein
MSRTAVKVKKVKKMSMPQLKVKAKQLGIDPGKMKKTELIHTMQTREGYNPCFGHSNGYCPQENCCFRGDCLP